MQEEPEQESQEIRDENAGIQYFIRPTEQRVRIVLLTLTASCALMVVLGSFAYQLLAMALHWDNTLIINNMAGIDTAAERWQVRAMLGINHLSMFIAAGIATVWLMYRKYIPENKALIPDGYPWLNWRNYLGLQRLPSVGSTLFTIALMLSSVPLVLYSYQLNKALPLPESLRLMDKQSSEALLALIQTDSVAELLANIVLIAVLPAIGEELVFRGIVQNQLMRRIARPLVAILVSAALFSFVHLQFEGFLPRLIMGLVLGWVYWRSGNFWLPMAAHFFNNGIQVLGQYLYDQQVSSIDLEKDHNIPWYSALISVALMYLLAQALSRSLGKKFV